MRLVSSAQNLTLSLFTPGRVSLPIQAFQDMYLEIPKEGLASEIPDEYQISSAKLKDVEDMVVLEKPVESTVEKTFNISSKISEKSGGLWCAEIVRVN